MPAVVLASFATPETPARWRFLLAFFIACG
jgi:hypothetical protein